MKKKLIIFAFSLLLLLGVSSIYVRMARETPVKTSREVQIPLLTNSPLPKFSFGFAGEMIFARDVASKIKQKNDYKFPFLKVASLTNSADFFFATLEAPLSGRNTPCGKDCMRFVADGDNIEGLLFAGIDGVSLAANHIMDGSGEALQDTLSILAGSKVLYTGAGLDKNEIAKPIMANLKGVKIGILAYNDIYPYVNTSTADNLKAQVSDLGNVTDLVFVSFHWGEEYNDRPTNRQKKLAHDAIDAGADLVIGDHPHWIQGIEFYQDKPIFYSVGNFVFDQMWSLPTRRGIIVFCGFEGKELTEIKIFPFQIEEFAQPNLLSEEESQKVIDQILSLSEPSTREKLRSLGFNHQ